MNSWPRRIYRSLSLLLAAFGTACTATSHAIAMDLVGYNYTDRYVAAYSVNGYPGANIYPHEGGGKFVCCISVPAEWQPGMTVTVKWSGKRNTNPIPWKTRIVDVPPYTSKDRGHLAVHFFPNDEVKVLVTTKIVGHPDYPYPYPDEGVGR
ncbi:DUF3304 domain-containing protein [Cupriavidus sp. 2MCAB6]|uniref:DUF3304 domain-containing protein n=1 Tax=Cupriavidus sp. 2MCAB6 TaxID=3232981 RepID=UPI003F93F206